MRTKKALINVLLGMASQAVIVIFTFVSRRLFITYLGYDYLGISSVFTGVITMLSLAEMGAGTAVSCCLYKPLADGDDDMVASLLQLLRKLYYLVAGCIAILGLILMPFLRFFIRESYPLSFLSSLFALFLLDTVCTYFLSYKKVLLIADQNHYVVSITGTLKTVTMNLLQIAVLYLTRSFYLFLLARIVSNLADNYACMHIANKRYPFLKDGRRAMLPEDTKQEIKTIIKSLVMHNVGIFFVNGTGAILFAIFIGVASAGVYANYTMLTGTIITICGQFAIGITAGFGSLTSSESTGRVRSVLARSQLAGYFMYSFVSISFFILANPFLSLFMRQETVFSLPAVTLMAATLYLSGYTQPLGSLRASVGLFRPDRYLHLILAALNIVLTIALIRLIGYIGILLGIFLCTVIKDVCFLPRIVHKELFSTSLSVYFRNFFRYLASAVAVACLTFLIAGRIALTNRYFDFAVKTVVCLLVINGLNLLLFVRMEEFRDLKESIKLALSGLIQNAE